MSTLFKNLNRCCALVAWMFFMTTANGQQTISNLLVGEQGHGASWGGIRHSSVPVDGGKSYGILQDANGNYTLINKRKTGQGFIGFRIGNTSSFSGEQDKMVILENGNIGIGTNSPQYRFQVAGDKVSGINSFFDGRMAISAENPGIWFRNSSSGSDRSFIGSNTSNDNLYFYIYNANTKWDQFNMLKDGRIRMRSLAGNGDRPVFVDSDGTLKIGSSSGGSSQWANNSGGISYNNGKVGIGTSSPAYMLHVTGDIYANWFRSSGSSGWYSETHGGGWHMTDASWIRAYNNKHIYTGAFMRADGGMQVGPDGNTFGVYSGGEMRFNGTNFSIHGGNSFYINNTTASIFNQSLAVWSDGRVYTKGSLASKSLEGSGNRPVFADANGKLIIGSSSGISDWGRTGDSRISSSNQRVFIGATPNANSGGPWLEVGDWHTMDKTAILSNGEITIRSRNNQIQPGLYFQHPTTANSIAIGTNFTNSQHAFGVYDGQPGKYIMDLYKNGTLRLDALKGSGNRPLVADKDGNIVAATSNASSGDLDMNGFNIINTKSNEFVTKFKSNGQFGKIILEGSLGSDIELKGNVRNWNINNSNGYFAIQTLINGVFKAPLVVHEKGVAALELKVKVDPTKYGDFVFESDYELMPISALETYLKQHKHLPEVKTVSEVVADDSQINIAEYTLLLLKKVEELTIYTIQQQKEINALKARVSQTEKGDK